MMLLRRGSGLCRRGRWRGCRSWGGRLRGCCGASAFQFGRALLVELVPGFAIERIGRLRRLILGATLLLDRFCLCGAAESESGHKGEASCRGGRTPNMMQHKLLL